MANRPNMRRTLVSRFQRVRGGGLWPILLAAGVAVCCTLAVNWIAHQKGWRLAILKSSDRAALYLSEIHQEFEYRMRVRKMGLRR